MNRQGFMILSVLGFPSFPCWRYIHLYQSYVLEGMGRDPINSGFCDFVDRIYPIELEIKAITVRDRSASYLELHLEIDSEGLFSMTLYDKRDYFNFPIVKFLLICSNIPVAPVYGVYFSQLIRYSRACGSYQDILDRGLLLRRKLLNQGFLVIKLKW